MWIHRFRALRTGVRVACDEAGLVEPLRRLIATFEPLATDAGVELAYELRAAGRQRPELRCGDRSWPTPDDVLDLPPIFELDFYRQAVARCRDLWALHGAAVVVGGRALGLVAPSGHGKSTLALALVERGAGYLSDECLVVDERLEVGGLQRPLSLDCRPAPLPAGFQVVDYPVPERDRGQDVAVLVHPPAALRPRGAAPLAALICLRYAPASSGAELRRLSAGPALERLWASTLNVGETALDIAVTAVERRSVYELASGAVAPALAALAAFGDINCHGRV